MDVSEIPISLVDSPVDAIHPDLVEPTSLGWRWVVGAGLVLMLVDRPRGSDGTGGDLCQADLVRAGVLAARGIDRITND